MCAAIFFVACATAACGGAEPESEVRARQCEQVREHLVDLRLETASGLTPQEVKQHRSALRASLDDGFLARCAETLTESQLSCIVDAKDAAAASACSRAPTSN